MGNITIELDKQIQTGLTPTEWGTINIRLVVVKSKADAGESDENSDNEFDDEPEAEVSKGPLDSYLERKGGKGYVVFLVNGQKHDQLDEWFVGRDLGFKYIKGRTMIVVEVDGLAPEAIAQLLQSSRQGFYKGDVYDAIVRRLVTVLKADPDLKRFEADAEQAISELRAGDEAVRRKLDHLIEGHHSAAGRQQEGDSSPGTMAKQGGGQNPATTEFVINANPDIGISASLPVLTTDAGGSVIRLHPNESKVLHIMSLPAEAWGKVISPRVSIIPEVSELKITIEEQPSGLSVTLRFDEPEDFPAEDFPLISALKVSAHFEGEKEPRLLERELFINTKKSHPPRPVPALRSQPTFLRVVSRQPVKLQPGGAATHIRLRWDGEDELASGYPPTWVFSARCLSLNTFPVPDFSQPRYGNFEVLLYTPAGLLPGQKLDFQIEATGPNGAILATPFGGVVAEQAQSLEPRKVTATAPEGGARKAPYELAYIVRANWTDGSVGCWGEGDWSKDDAGCFLEPTQSKPLVLVINEDAAVIKAATDQMLERKLEDTTIRERTARYQTHIAFHLYRMYLDYREIRQGQPGEEDAPDPSESHLRAEINRVAATLSELLN
jgi:hypothetical protein